LAEEKERNLRLYGLKVIPTEDDDLMPYRLWMPFFSAATAKLFESRIIVGSEKDFKEIDI